MSRFNNSEGWYRNRDDDDDNYTEEYDDDQQYNDEDDYNGFEEYDVGQQYTGRNVSSSASYGWSESSAQGRTEFDDDTEDGFIVSRLDDFSIQENDFYENEDYDEGASELDAGAAYIPATHPHHGPIPDHPDSKDHIFQPKSTYSTELHVDLRDRCPPVYNQLQMLSCTAHAVAGAFEFDVDRQGLPAFSPSRLFIWYNARAKSTDPYAIKKNCGSELRAAIQSLDFHALGVCDERDWSYEVGDYDKKTHFFVKGAKAAMKPPVLAQQHAHQHTATATEYQRIAPRGQESLFHLLIDCLNQGYPFVFGMKTFNLLSGNRIDEYGQGLVLPTPRDKQNGEHRHSLMAVGYIPSEKQFIIRNSWGETWGENGHFYMSYDYLRLYCYDFWTIRVRNSRR